MRMIHSFWLCLAITYLQAQPLDDICPRKILEERVPLAHAPIQERDIFWEKKVVRVIDFREKMNQYFQAPENHFMETVMEGIKAGSIDAYEVDEKIFGAPLSSQALDQLILSWDTIEVYDPGDYEPRIEIVQNQLDYNSITSIRLLEKWYFDSQLSQLRVRILGIAPIITVLDNFGNERYQKPLFWIHYPGAREYLARHAVAHDSQSNQAVSWEDQFERRFFASTIYQVSNIQGDRLKDRYSGLELLQQAEKEKMEIFNFEHDLWSW